MLSSTMWEEMRKKKNTWTAGASKKKKKGRECYVHDYSLQICVLEVSDSRLCVSQHSFFCQVQNKALLCNKGSGMQLSRATFHGRKVGGSAEFPPCPILPTHHIYFLLLLLSLFWCTEGLQSENEVYVSTVIWEIGERASIKRKVSNRISFCRCNLGSW